MPTIFLNDIRRFPRLGLVGICYQTATKSAIDMPSFTEIATDILVKKLTTATVDVTEIIVGCQVAMRARGCRSTRQDSEHHSAFRESSRFTASVPIRQTQGFQNVLKSAFYPPKPDLPTPVDRLELRP